MVDASDGALSWIRVALLSFSGVFVPLFCPRNYIPIDPEVRTHVTEGWLPAELRSPIGTAGVTSRTDRLSFHTTDLHLRGATDLARVARPAADL